MRKKVYVLVTMAIVLVLLIGTVVILIKNPAPADSSSGVSSAVPEITVLKIDKATIDEVSGINSAGSFAIKRKDSDNFTVKGKETIPVDSYYVDAIVGDVSELKANLNVTESASNIAEYGLDKPSINVTVKTADKTEYNLLFGNKTVNGDYYFKLGSSDAVYVVASNITDDFNKTNLGLYSKTIAADVTADTITDVNLKKAGSDTISYKKMETTASTTASSSVYNEEFKLLSPFEYTGDSDVISVVNTSIASLYATSAETDDFSAANLKKYGLDKPEYTLDYTYSSKTITLYFSKKVGNDYSFYLKDRPLIYKIAATSAAFLEKTVSDLCYKLLYSMDIKSVAKLKIEGGGKSYLFELTGSDTDNMTVKYNGSDINAANFRKLYKNVILAQQNGSASKPNTQSKYKISFNLKDGYTDVLEFYEVDSRNLFASVKGTGHFTVSVTRLEKIMADAEKLIAGQDIAVG